MKPYEVSNPDLQDMSLEEQIEAKVNDWCVDGKSGHPYYGHTPAKALSNAAQFNYQ